MKTYFSLKDINQSFATEEHTPSPQELLLNDIKKTISKFIDKNDDISLTYLLEQLSKLENIDDSLNIKITNIKEKVDNVKSDLLKSINNNRTNISNIEIKIGDIYNKLSNINNTNNNNEIVDLEPIKSDIVDLSKIDFDLIYYCF